MLKGKSDKDSTINCQATLLDFLKQKGYYYAQKVVDIDASLQWKKKTKGQQL